MRGELPTFMLCRVCDICAAPMVPEKATPPEHHDVWSCVACGTARDRLLHTMSWTCSEVHLFMLDARNVAEAEVAAGEAEAAWRHVEATFSTRTPDPSQPQLAFKASE